MRRKATSITPRNAATSRTVATSDHNTLQPSRLWKTR